MDFWPGYSLCYGLTPLRPAPEAFPAREGGGGEDSGCGSPALTHEHVMVGIVRDGEEVRRHFCTFLAFVHLGHSSAINGQPLVRVDCHTEQAGVGLEGAESSEDKVPVMYEYRSMDLELGGRNRYEAEFYHPTIGSQLGVHCLPVTGIGWPGLRVRWGLLKAWGRVLKMD